MDKYLISLKRAFVVLIMMLVYDNLYAVEFEVDGIMYRSQTNANTVSVLGKNNNYTGAIVIPETVTYQSINYTVTTISEGAFSGNKDITSIVIPPTITFIDEEAFYQCVNLDIVYISSIESWCNIGFDWKDSNPLGYAKHLFIDGKEVNDIVIPEEITIIDEYAFYGFVGIKSITLPKTLEWIYKFAFKDCSNLELVISKCTKLPHMDSDYASPFSGISPNAKLIVPQGTIDLYLASPYWSNYFAEITEEVSTYSLTITAYGNGSVSYGEATIRNNTSSFSVNEGTSATISFSPDSGYRIKRVKVNDTDVTSSVSSNSYTIGSISANTTLEVEFEAIPPTTYTLSIKAIGNGSASYNGTIIRSNTSTFTVNEGTSVTITLTPDNGYRIKSVKENNTNVTSYVSNSTYTINSISRDTNVEVEFEAIPPTTYSLSITATGNGTAAYNGTTIRGKTSTFTVNEGTSATISFSPDNGYRAKSVKVNNTDVTSSVSSNQYTISKISANTTLEVEFEAIPITTYTLSITATGNGSASYSDTTIRRKTNSFTVNEGTTAIISFSPDYGYRIKSVKENNTNVTAYVSNDTYTISSISRDTNVEVEFEAIPPTTYTLSITALGNGYAAYDGNIIRGKFSSFTVTEGTSATVKFSANDGNRLRSVKLNNVDVTAAVTGNQYTISNITADTSLEVVFEAIPTYSLSITASGNGSVTYNSSSIRNQNVSFTVQEGASAVISISPDNGYRIASMKVNNSDVTSQVNNGNMTITNIVQNTNVEVTFEEIPATTYSLSITASGNGSVTYDGKTVRNSTSEFNVAVGTYAVVQIAPDEGYRLKRVTMNAKDVTADVVDGQYTTSKMTGNATLLVEFEVVPTYSLTIESTAFGSVTYDDTVIRNNTKTFSVTEGASAVLTFTPNNNGRLQSVTLNDVDITQQLMNGQYTISDIRSDQHVEAVFVEDVSKVTYEGVAYTVTSYSEQTVVVASGNYGHVLTIPASFTVGGITWKVVGVDEDALIDNNELAAVIWKPELKFDGRVSNPNLLLYVKAAQYASPDIQNIIVGDLDNGKSLLADNIILVEAENGNDFYCPLAFIAKRISYEHNYSMISGYKTCQGWESLVLPFDVSMMISNKGTELVPYTLWEFGSNLRPYWIYELTTQGWQAANGIKANVPYIISMPNNEAYDSSYNITGNIEFVGNNVQIMVSENVTIGQHGNKRLVANYRNQDANNGIYALNVNNQWNNNTDSSVEGSAFIRGLRQVRPFEAYLTLEGSNAGIRSIPVFDNETTGVAAIPVSGFGNADAIYNLNGQRVNSMSRGIYIQNGRKIVKK